MKTTSSILVVALGLAGVPLLADTPATSHSGPVSNQATAGIQYNPAAATTAAHAAQAAATGEGVTALPAVNVTETQKHTKRDVDHDVKVTQWLEKPAAFAKPVGTTVKLALLAPPKEGANGKVEEPLVDLDW